MNCTIELLGIYQGPQVLAFRVWLPCHISKIPLDQEQYTVFVPLVGEDFVHQPLIVFSITKVVIHSDFHIEEDLAVVFIEQPQTTYME